jgi:Arc/MetJ family transcription regulator
MYIQVTGGEYMKTAVRMTSIRLDTKLADDAVKTLGARSRSEAVHIALREVVALRKFKELMAKHGGKMKFEAHGR